MKKSFTKVLTRAGIIACLYVVLSLVTFGFNGGAIQLRLSEGLTILPLFFVESIPALFVGCLLSNLISGLALIDVIFGALITLLAGVFTYLVGKLVKRKDFKVLLGGIFPVILNALLLPVIWKFCYELEYIYSVQALFLFCSQCISVYGLGTPTFFTIKRLRDKDVSFLN